MLKINIETKNVGVLSPILQGNLTKQFQGNLAKLIS